MVGLPLAAHRAVDLNPEADFLGLVHNFSRAALDQNMAFVPRPSLVEKATGLLQEALLRNFCTPAQASKVCGVLGFLFTGAFGKVGRGGQQALRQRQYSDQPPFTLSNSLRAACKHLAGLLR